MPTYIGDSTSINIGLANQKRMARSITADLDLGNLDVHSTFTKNINIDKEMNEPHGLRISIMAV